MPYKRRQFIKQALLSLSGMSLVSSITIFNSASQTGDINVVVWDERQPEQKKVYENFMGNEIAGYLRNQPGLNIQSVGLDDPGQGLTDTIMDGADILIWWGHIRQDEIEWKTGRKIIDRIEKGTLSMITLHSAHWSTPFMEAMNRVTQKRAEEEFPGHEINYIFPPDRFTTPEYDTRVTPYTQVRKYPDGRERINVHLPYCCFPAYRDDGKPSYGRFIRSNHPIAHGLSESFEVPQSEMYDEPFHVPEPDEVVFEERWSTGEWFRSGMVWQLGEGRIFYFRPGHETYPVFKDERTLKILENAVRWLNKT
ncbi:ThuA domain-containing protein [Halalkalibaculum sp. DA3122]|uniref:ThuA domain-containing protein n=1 Tax=Halalkalibaculum sp. DA3122 TaxID=3373607 RepID=UPI0037543DD8